MGSLKMDLGRVFLMRVDYDSDIIKFISSFARANELGAATFTAIGALKSAKLGFYDQRKHEYLENRIEFPNEIVSCTGNISIKKGEAFVHAHVVLADSNGNAKAGHLLEGKVFAAEVHIFELVDKKVERKYDEVTGLSLWNI
jgi:predicted DNA-binding protein with PD1-like motif